MDNIKIGSFLQALRKAKGMTQAEIGEYFNISSKTVSKWECGDSLPEIPMLKALAEFYDVTVDEILNGERREVSNNLVDKNRKDISEYFIKKHYSRLNLWFLIATSLLVLVFIMLYMFSSIGIERNVIYPIKITICLISLFFNFFGLYISGSMPKDFDIKIRKKYLMRKIFYSYEHLLFFIFVIYHPFSPNITFKNIAFKIFVVEIASLFLAILGIIIYLIRSRHYK